MTPRIFGFVLGIGLAVTARPVVVAQSVPPQPQPTFRAITSLVPIDVRVLDRSGKPITDLKASDFTILEDGAPQKLGHFSVTTLSTPAPTAGASGPLRRVLPADAAPLQPQTRRMFLIALGRGLLQPPSKGVDGAIEFVRDRLLPDDYVAVMAFNRATDFTLNRGQLLQVLERFKTMHPIIEAKLRQAASGLGASARSAAVMQEIQRDIDAIFKGVMDTRELPEGRVTDAETRAADERRTADILARGELLQQRAAAAAAMGIPVSEFDKLEMAEARNFELSFEEFTERTSQTMQDLGRLYAGIDYMRYIDGEKHLLFVTERGLTLPRVDSDLSLAAAANTARVTINIIQTGGHAPTLKPAFKNPGFPPGMTVVSVADGEPIWQRLIVSSMREIANLTGGQASLYEFADKAFQRIAESTTSGYLLGYYPTNPAYDGRYRRVTVKVNRPGAKVLYRHGYFAQPPREPLDRRRAVTYNRIASAVSYARDIADLDLELGTAEIKGAGRFPDFAVDLRIDIRKIALTIAEGRHKGALDIAVFCQDAEGNGIGDLWQKMELNLSQATFERMSKEGLSYNGRIPLSGVVKHVKVVVYDYASDRIGTIMRQVR
jgi:VWFA-related protein